MPTGMRCRKLSILTYTTTAVWYVFDLIASRVGPES